MLAHRTVVRSLVLLLLLVATVPARDWYVCAATGKGKKGTREAPAKDLGSILSKLEPGDRIFIAEGVYFGRGRSGCDVIDVPVEIYGGFDPTFDERDPWGAHRTILSGDNLSKNWKREWRLTIDLTKNRKLREHRVVVDGIIVDQAGRNRYATPERHAIVRTANPKTGENPTPASGGIRVRPNKGGDVLVKSCVVINSAPSEGAFSIWGHQGSEVEVTGNLSLNNTGNGFNLHSLWHGSEGEPEFLFTRNSALFTEKPDPASSDGGSGLKLEASCRVTVRGNVLGFCDRFGIDNGRSAKEVVVESNVFTSNLAGAYLEFDTAIGFASIEDESEMIDSFDGNREEKVKVAVSKNWAGLYAARTVLDRAAAEADVEVADTPANQLRAMLGLPLIGSDADFGSPAWLPCISLEDALGAAASVASETSGCRAPSPVTTDATGAIAAR